MEQTLDFNRLLRRLQIVRTEQASSIQLLDLYDQDLIAFDMWGRWSYADADSWRDTNEQWLGSLGSESVVVEFDDINTLYGAEMAAAYATVTYRAVSETGEVLRSMQNRLTWVAERNEWWLENSPSTYFSADRSRQDEPHTSPLSKADA